MSKVLLFVLFPAFCAALSGFGASSSTFSPEAKLYLQKCDNNLDAAQAMHFKEQVEKLPPATQYALQKKDASVHDLLVSLTWDSVAMFLPPMPPPAPPKALRSKLKSIASACSGSLLDIGCGDGSLIPHLRKMKDFDSSGYHGLDSSPLMIKLASASYPKLSFSSETFD